MDEWNTRHHTESGLIDEVRQSEVGLEEAEARTLDFVRRHVDEPETAPLCGNSIGHDRRFLYRYMPDLSDFLHYRSVDVSSIKELVVRWYDDVEPPDKEAAHRALADIRESIDELRHYRKHAFVEA
jgi:oligoribonuclease